MEPRDYVIDPSFLRTKHNRLLDNEGAGPNPALTQSSELALAAIADVVHKHARHLNPDQAEIAVRWLKQWKLQGALPRDYNDLQARDAFDVRLKAIRESPEQVRLQAVANRHGTWSRVWTAVFVGTLATMVGMSLAGGAGAVAWIIAAAALIGAFIASERCMVRALVTAKEQDRRYSLASLHAARTTTELVNAGLCQYIPGVLYEGPDYDEKRAKAQMFKERERLADALYLDPDGLLDPYSFRDNGPRVSPIQDLALAIVIAKLMHT